MTDRRVLNRAGQICTLCPGAFATVAPLDEAAFSMIYTLARVVILGMNDLDQCNMDTARTKKLKLELTKEEILYRLEKQFEDLMKEFHDHSYCRERR